MEIKPLIGVGPLEFGMTQKEVRQAIKKPADYSESQLTNEFVERKDYFLDGDIVAYYDDNLKLEAVEFFDQNLKWENLNLDELSYGNILTFIQGRDESLKVEIDSITSDRFGIRIALPDSEEEIPRNIIVFSSNYLVRNTPPDVQDILDFFGTEPPDWD